MCIKPDEVLNDHNSTSEDMSTSTLLRQVSDISSSRVHLTLIVLNKMSGAIYDSGTALSVPEGGSVKKRKSDTDLGQEIQDRNDQRTEWNEQVSEVQNLSLCRTLREQNAKEQGKRVEKKVRARRRPNCCACQKVSTCNDQLVCSNCGHERCAQCCYAEY